MVANKMSVLGTILDPLLPHVSFGDTYKDVWRNDDNSFIGLLPIVYFTNILQATFLQKSTY